jgi:hypothetical protein
MHHWNVFFWNPLTIRWTKHPDYKKKLFAPFHFGTIEKKASLTLGVGYQQWILFRSKAGWNDESATAFHSTSLYSTFFQGIGTK